jgi:arsenate reductase
MHMSGKQAERYIFACVHNAGRSQMAAAFFERSADPQKAQALSAGTAPAGHVHPEVIETMREIGIDLAGAQPQRLTAELAAGARMLVTMGCGEQCPLVPGVEREDWQIEDPKGKDVATVRQIREEIAERVRRLIETRRLG